MLLLQAGCIILAMEVEIRRNLQEEAIALNMVKFVFNSLIPDSQAEDWETCMTENRHRAMALCRVQRCFGERLRRDAKDLTPVCLFLAII